MTLAFYVPRRSLVHRAPAGLKLLVLAGLGVLLFMLPTLAVAGAALAAVLLVGLGVARLPVAVLARQARAVIWWLVALLVVHWLVTDLMTGAITALRLETAAQQPQLAVAAS